jgi:hypothetical protein
MIFGWNSKKNEELVSEGRSGFEEAVEAIKKGVLKDDENPIHPGQRIFVVMIKNYPHVVPYETRGDLLWLITVYPARRYKR